MIQRSIYLDDEDFNYMKDNRYPFAEFMRKAIQAHKDGKWEY